MKTCNLYHNPVAFDSGITCPVCDMRAKRVTEGDHHHTASEVNQLQGELTVARKFIAELQEQLKKSEAVSMDRLNRGSQWKLIAQERDNRLLTIQRALTQ